jgi:glucosamine--fructose-6-phosphate aminotransferase (isomerizing)
MSGYVDDIRGQAEALQALLDAPPRAEVLDALASRHFDRIVLSGMGASHFANHAVWRDLAAAGAPAWWVETGELLHGADGLVTGRTLVWLTSQSGESGEVVALLDRLTGRTGVTVLAVTNDPGSTLALSADLVVDIRAGAEHTVSTRTFVNTVAANHLVSAGFRDRRRAESVRALEDSREELATYLTTGFEQHLAEAERAAETVRRLVVVGRGHSYGSAATGALTIKEAAKFHAEAMTASQFRHGPLELAGPELTVVVLPGDGTSAKLDRQLAEDLLRYRAQVVWVGDDGPPGGDRIQRAADTVVGRTLTDVVPLQLLSVALARRDGIEAGEFVHARKVTSAL